ncbi:MAG: 23S rRNA (adenine(2030)-N(6))-methyltransferase RlmJ [Nevskiaceae bacterium]|nr:MAG: 23S rRNA (adenine(2030)-N(6))-methyltransferase RlmJ [Nevskiaceae bacterium]TBR72260.1 MAG: 23S rRNA (adenine(2030)-N(6))-methyltransferase RlmJ [Nevskiaceae bacterium]
MHYRHAYHAGNFADVFKHLLMLAALQALSRKDKPWCFTDTHAGAGAYALRRGTPAAEGPAAEWEAGIGRLWDKSPRDPLLADYLEAVRAFAGEVPVPARYPGSPWLAARLARPGDRIVACEKLPEIAAELRYTVAQAKVLNRDGYEMAAALPPKERRGLVLVDPPFERPDEFDAARAFITAAAARYAGGVFALWYPLKNPHAADHALRCLARDTRGLLLDSRFDVGSEGDGRMHACGMAVLNPPYQFAETVQPALTELAGVFGPRARVTLGTVAAP